MKRYDGSPIQVNGSLIMTIRGPKVLNVGEETAFNIKILNNTGVDLRQIIVKRFLPPSIVQNAEIREKNISFEEGYNLSISEDFRDGEEINFDIKVKLMDSSQLGCIKYKSFKTDFSFPTSFEGITKDDLYVVGPIRVYETDAFLVNILPEIHFSMFIDGKLVGEKISLRANGEYTMKIIIRKKGPCLEDVEIEGFLPKEFDILEKQISSNWTVERSRVGYNLTIHKIKGDLEEIEIRFVAKFGYNNFLSVSPRLVLDKEKKVEYGAIIFQKETENGRKSFFKKFGGFLKWLMNP